MFYIILARILELEILNLNQMHMRTLKLQFLMILSGLLLGSCTIFVDDTIEDTVSLDELIASYDLWYVDIHRTTGTGDVLLYHEHSHYHLSMGYCMLIIIFRE